VTSIIFEGPDGSGKSFAAERCSLAANVFVHHSGGSPKNPIEFFNRIAEQLGEDEVIFDRFSIISELVYGKVLRDDCLLYPSYWTRLIKHPVVYFRPPIQVLLSTKLENKPHKSKKQVQEVINKYKQIVDQYDFLMKAIPHIKFDRYNQKIEELERCVELIFFLGKIQK